MTTPVQTHTHPVPFGMRHLTPPRAGRPSPDGGYDTALQLNVTTTGNPWHALAAGETKTETDGGDGKAGNTDGDGTDLF
ncbi:putative ATP-grasp-modified RiPP [Embleya sp. AB8]|uniref:putative ATP-grasp-modified RiPP n=1 Tax=Embleya sp. AB8 TaxID=3156304 RepID=UPI003C78D111